MSDDDNDIKEPQRKLIKRESIVFELVIKKKSRTNQTTIGKKGRCRFFGKR